jgi:cytochrome c-type biogenesis protein CcmE
MNRRFHILLIVVAAAVVTLLFSATEQGTSESFEPSTLLQKQPAEGTRIRVVGKVVEGIEYQVEPSIRLAFRIEDPTGTGPQVAVVYPNLKPDMFTPGRVVIVDGRWVQGKLEAYALLTQCPSKYEPPKPPGAA